MAAVGVIGSAGSVSSVWSSVSSDHVLTTVSLCCVSLSVDLCSVMALVCPEDSDIASDGACGLVSDTHRRSGMMTVKVGL